MKYVHLADLHLGSWRIASLQEVAQEAFNKAIAYSIKEEVDFVLFAGDLFHTSLPPIDTLKKVTKQLTKLKKNNIPLYVIPGSHDFSPTGKSMIDVLEAAGLLTNVCKGTINKETKKLELTFTIDQKTQTKITGIIGRKGQLDKTYYENLSLETLEQEEGHKIFMFHTTISELLTNNHAFIDSQPISFLPKNFNYYAGGHIHHPTKKEISEYGTLTYTGALFPTNFSELEDYSHGGFFQVSIEQAKQSVEWIPLKIKEHLAIKINTENKTAQEVTQEIIKVAKEKECTNKIITLRVKGKLSQGKIADINFTQAIDVFYERGAYCVLKNTNKLQANTFQEIKINHKETGHLEEELIKEHLAQSTIFEKSTQETTTKKLLQTINTQKKEGETTTSFEQRVISEIDTLLKQLQS